MWVGSFEKLKECSSLTEEVKTKMLDFINNNDLETLPLGRHELGGDDYVNVFEYETHANKGVFLQEMKSSCGQINTHRKPSLMKQTETIP